MLLIVNYCITMVTEITALYSIHNQTQRQMQCGLLTEGGALGSKHKETQILRQQVQRLEMENNFLQLKTEVLLDMVGLMFYN